MENNESGTILVVDDNDGLRRMTVMLLERQGYSVIEANSGSEGLERFTEHHNKVDMVLSDVRMPKMNGMEMVEQILTLDPTVPVMFMTGYNGDSKIPDSVPVLPKPFTPALLIQAVRECLATPS